MQEEAVAVYLEAELEGEGEEGGHFVGLWVVGFDGWWLMLGRGSGGYVWECVGRDER